MKLRPPSAPLITVDPYFSVWSPADKLYDETTTHWTGKPVVMLGTVNIDGEDYRFMGKGDDLPVITQRYLNMTALDTQYVFRNEKITLDIHFYTPLFPDDLYRLSRPVSYFTATYKNEDEVNHKVSIKLQVSEEICLNKKGDWAVNSEIVKLDDKLTAAKIGSAEQRMLFEEGDDQRIEWGYFYLCGPIGSDNRIEKFKPEYYDDDDEPEMTFAVTEFELKAFESATALFAYDDIYCLEYFNNKVEAYWKKSGKTIEEAICEAYNEAEEILDKCDEYNNDVYEKVLDVQMDSKEFDEDNGKYVDLLVLAYRQLIAAHKLAVDENGEIIFISKECFSNGCTATVDVTYPSSPFFLLYNTELLKGMLRPIFRYTRMKEWVFDFAPHDVGTYPLVNGQRYGWIHQDNIDEYFKCQMPVEECGNMLILMANIAMIDGNTDFCDPQMDILSQWVKYLEKYGADPENQLCTDDFAGHLAHNCNLSLKAIMGIAGYAQILRLQGKNDEAGKYMAEAKEMADSWIVRASNDDGSFRLAFDKPDTFSMKYNYVWDKLWGTKLFPPYVIYSEFASNKKHINPYGMPLDNRKNYTKSDWLVWNATLAPTFKEFMEFITPLWNAYNVTLSRVPMTDWYDTNTANQIAFQNRTVQGGLFIKLLEGKF